MNKKLDYEVHFFNTLRDIVVSHPYAILSFEEVNSLVSQIDILPKVPSAKYEPAFALRQAVDNARGDGYFPLVVLPVSKYEAARSLLRMD